MAVSENGSPIIMEAKTTGRARGGKVGLQTYKRIRSDPVGSSFYNRISGSDRTLEMIVCLILFIENKTQ